MTAQPSVRRVRDGAEIEDLCEAHQPLALLVSSPVNEVDGRERARCWVVGERGAELGAVTAVQVRPGTVTASALLLDPDAAPTLASLVRRAGASRLSGGAAHVGPIAERIPGATTHPLELLGAPPRSKQAPRSVDGLQPDVRARARTARADDLPALVALYEQFPLEFIDPAELAAVLAGLVQQHRVLVVVADGRIVAAQRVEARSRHWNLWGGLTIAPEDRGQGYSRWLDRWAGELGRIENRSAAGVRAPSNGVPHPLEGMVVEPWLEVVVPVAPTFAHRAERWARRQARTRLGTVSAGAAR